MRVCLRGTGTRRAHPGLLGNQLRRSSTASISLSTQWHGDGLIDMRQRHHGGSIGECQNCLQGDEDSRACSRAHTLQRTSQAACVRSSNSWGRRDLAS